MANIFFISDTHFFHANFLKFTDYEGKAIRPFSSVEEMNEVMAVKWNDRVKPQDHIYHLGDVTFDYGPKFRELMHRLNGRKRLLVGNHDRLKGTCLVDYFDKIGTIRYFKEHGLAFSHIPIHASGLRHDTHSNVHGHTHNTHVGGPRYLNICVEQTDYAPIHMDEVVERLRQQRRQEDIKKGGRMTALI